MKPHTRPGLLSALGGHWWTVRPVVARQQVALPSSEPIRFDVEDPAVGTVTLSGRLHPTDGARELLLIVHGLGGCAESHYLPGSVHAAQRHGMAALRLNLRGADRQGGDFFHAGLSSDLAAVLAAPQLADYERVHVLGFSVGGHLALKLATEEASERLAGVAAVCPPLDLEQAVVSFDRPSRWPYRHYVLRGLRQIYGQVAARRSVPVPVEQVQRIGLLRELDAATVVPRFGFADTGDYYRQASVGPRLASLRVPALLIVADADPMVPPQSCVQPYLRSLPPKLELRWVKRGGHVSFPRNLDLQMPGDLGLEGQILGWMAGRNATSPHATSPHEREE